MARGGEGYGKGEKLIFYFHNFSFFLLLLGLLLSPGLGHTGEPVEEDGSEDVEPDVDPKKAEVAPAVICIVEKKLV